jgi:polar amino acid transport system substrate-binding protein
MRKRPSGSRRPRRAVLAAVLVGVGLLAAVPAGPAAAAEPLTLLVFERPPYYVRQPDGSYGGMVAGRVGRALAAAGIAFTWRRLPPNGHLRTVAADDGRVCAVGWFRTPSREDLGLFSAPIVRERPQVVLARADNTAVLAHERLETLLADDDLRLGARLGYVFGAALDGMLAPDPPPRITVTQDDMGLARMLLGRRFDYMFTSAAEADALLTDLGPAGADLVTLALPDMPPGDSRHLVCSRTVGHATMTRINAALAELDEAPQ